MKEIISLFSRAKANRCGKSPSFSTEALAPFHGSLSEMPLRSIPAITWLIKLSNEQTNATMNPIGGSLQSRVLHLLVECSRQIYEDVRFEIDINPLVVLDKGKGVKAVEARIVL